MATQDKQFEFGWLEIGAAEFGGAVTEEETLLTRWTTQSISWSLWAALADQSSSWANFGTITSPWSKLSEMPGYGQPSPSTLAMALDLLLEPIQLLGPMPNRSVNLTVTGSTSNIAFPTGAVIVQLVCLEDMWIRLGDGGTEATATDTLFLFGQHIIETNGNTHIAAIRDTEDGTLNITELE